MDQKKLAFADDQRSLAQPVEQLVAIGRFQNRLNRVEPMRRAISRGDDQQMKIVVAQDRLRGGSQIFHGAQYRERVRASIHEITDEPQPIAGWIESDQVEQLPEFCVAALDVSDDVVPHWKASRCN